jgi:hypothetical protein
MPKALDLKNFNVSYHRNGISGNGFHLCRFTYRPNGQPIEMQAVVFAGQGNVAVTSERLHDRWRGDQFEGAIRECIRLFEKHNPMAMHDHTEGNQLAAEAMRFMAKQIEQ